MTNPTIALLTDFGTRDPYVGIMKAVIRRIAPQATCIDLTHEIRPQNVRQAAFTLLQCYPYLPAGTIFLCVVDPGVGSSRKPVVASAGGYHFFAPDNGLLTYALDELGDAQLATLTNPAYQLPQISNTFHGRDIFAPAAAHLATGVPLTEFGPSLERLVRQMSPSLKTEPGRITGQVLYADHFGNIITSIGQLQWLDEHTLQLNPRIGKNASPLHFGAGNVEIQLKDQRLIGIHHRYSEVVANNLVALVDSNGYLEIARNQGSAAAGIAINGNEPVTITLKD
jgi:S-adenosyl-L-methionine hydrolase (adenosine-forming)